MTCEKAKVEGGVLIVERWILAKLRHETFFWLGDLNASIAYLLGELNGRPFKKLPGNRQSRFIEDEKAHLKPLPLKPYEFATWTKARVHLDYHVEIDKRYYSAPYHLIGKSVDARLTVRVVELFYRGKLVASHVKNTQPGKLYHLPCASPAQAPCRHRAQSRAFARTGTGYWPVYRRLDRSPVARQAASGTNLAPEHGHLAAGARLRSG